MVMDDSVARGSGEINITKLFAHIVCTKVHFLEFVLQSWGFPGGSVEKNLPTVQETQVRYLGWEDPLEESITTHSSILDWRIPWTEEPGGLQSMGSQRTGQTNPLTLSLSLFPTGCPTQVGLCLPAHPTPSAQNSVANSLGHAALPGLPPSSK